MLAPAARPADPPPVTLPPYEVVGERITDFGMSVRTNFGVALGGKIEWMRVGTVVDGSSAALAGLRTDDQILLVDRVSVRALERDAMLTAFFDRGVGDRLTLVIREDRTRRFRQVTLRANAKRVAR